MRRWRARDFVLKFLLYAGMGLCDVGRHLRASSSMRIGTLHSKAKMRFQSFFMLTTVQPLFFAPS
jgi:hypothetical protein